MRLSLLHSLGASEVRIARSRHLSLFTMRHWHIRFDIGVTTYGQLCGLAQIEAQLTTAVIRTSHPLLLLTRC